MEQPRREGDGNTTSQLKDDIDSGRTGDKTATADPGLSPLGTDDEAAGRPTTPERVALARREELKIGRIATAGDRPKSNLPVLLMVGIIVVVAIVVIAFFAGR